MDLRATLNGTLTIHVASEWGDKIDLARVAALQGAGGTPLPRRRRTPASIDFRPPPVRVPLPPVPLDLPEIGAVQAGAEAALFDFGGVSVELNVPFALSPQGLAELAGHLADPAAIVRATRLAVTPLHQRLF